MRVLRACAAEGVDCVTVHSDADAGSLWANSGVESVRIGPPPVHLSYLNADALLRVAKDTGCDAVHPGYGLLSESATFARRVVESGIVWIGPEPDTIAAMGVKTQARRRMQSAGVPVVPGSDGPVATLDEAMALAAQFGFPVMVKAASGGGGIGMELAGDPAALERALKGVADRARRFFGGEMVYIEKALERPRHIEIQIFGDSHGNVVHLFERECSIQRRNQKVVEESPSPHRNRALIQKIACAAVTAARAVNYKNAGTVEFLVDARDEFYFLEMNCRLQVEHPVTELVTGRDLVREQLRVAAGAPLSFSQKELVQQGSAVEVRLYAEDPSRNYMPSPGALAEFDIPESEGVRVDAGYRAGDTITPYYDPLIAKIIFSGPTRESAIARGAEVLQRMRVAPLKTNLDLHRKILLNDAFRSGDIATDFLGRHLPRG